MLIFGGCMCCILQILVIKRLTLFFSVTEGWSFVAVEVVITVVFILILFGALGLLLWRLYGRRGMVRKYFLLSPDDYFLDLLVCV